MRRSFNIGVLFIFTIGLLVGNVYKGYAQDEKKKPRVTLYFTKIMEGQSYLTISAKFKGDDGFEPASGLSFDVFRTLQADSLVKIGSIATNNGGEGKFNLNTLTSNDADSTGTFNYLVSSTDNREFSHVEKSIGFKDADIDAEVFRMEDGVRAVKATLTDTYSKTPIADQPIKLQVQRLFRPLRIGEEFTSTDVDGTVIVPIDSTIPGIHGDLTLELVLNESDDYGTVIARISGNLGTPVVNRSTFNERTMWSPGSKTPLFLLLSFNGIMIGIWIVILFLIVNLIKIYKSKN